MPHWFGYGAVVLLSLYLAVYPGLATLMTWCLGTPVFLRRQDPSPAVSTGLLPTQEYGKLPLILLFAATWLGAGTPFYPTLLFVASGVGRIPVAPIIREVLPFMLWSIVVLFLAVFFPPLTTWLASQV